MKLNSKYPFDPLLKHHLIIALGLVIWIFVFLFFTEPLDVNTLNSQEKPLFLIGYGLIGGLCYIVFLPVQNYLYKLKNNIWTLKSEFLFISIFSFCSVLIARLYYLYVIMAYDRNPFRQLAD